MITEKKTILLTGGTGDIGGAIAKKLRELGHDVFAPMRSPEKPEAKELAAMDIQIAYCNLEDPEMVFDYIQSIASKDVLFDFSFNFAGVFEFDDTFPGDTQQGKEKNSIAYHEAGNLLTSQTVVFGLKKVFGKKLRRTILELTSSWAAHFAPDDPRRKNEEGYVQSKAKLSLFGQSLKEEGLFKDVLIEEPKFIISTMTRKKFPELIADPDYPKIPLEQYRDEFLIKTGFL